MRVQPVLQALPNAITLGRCVLAIVVAGALIVARLAGGSESGSSTPVFPVAIAFWAFVIAALSDYLDGWLARRLGLESAFGAWLDPLADKLLVGGALAGIGLLAANGFVIVPAIAIIARDAFVTWLRVRRGGGYALPVMRLAKWKTAFEMAGLVLILAALAFGPEGARVLPGGARPSGQDGLAQQVALGGLVLVWAAALVSLWTGWRYARTAMRARP